MFDRFCSNVFDDARLPANKLFLNDKGINSYRFAPTIRANASGVRLASGIFANSFATFTKFFCVIPPDCILSARFRLNVSLINPSFNAVISRTNSLLDRFVSLLNTGLCFIKDAPSFDSLTS